MGAEESAGGDALAGGGALARVEALCGAAVAGALQAARVEARAGLLLVAGDLGLCLGLPAAGSARQL